MVATRSALDAEMKRSGFEGSRVQEELKIKVVKILVWLFGYDQVCYKQISLYVNLLISIGSIRLMLSVLI